MVVIPLSSKADAANGSDAVQITHSADPALLLALEKNAPFPPQDIAIESISTQASGSKDIIFGSGDGKVSFSASGGMMAGLGVYTDPHQLVTDLNLDSKLAAGMKLSPASTDYRFLLLRWGYDAKAAAKGSLALGGPAGAITFGASASSEGVFGVIHEIPSNAPSFDALKETIGCWMLPRQVATAGDLRPGTWIVCEVDGSLALQLGAQCGFDFNWVRELEAGVLTGDIGLRIQTSLSAKLGFSAAGKYAVVVGRESLDPTEQKLRFRLFKLNTHGWNFALNAGVAIDAGQSTILPQQWTDLVRAIFGVHGAQIVADLQAISKWTDPKAPLPDLLAGLTSQYVQGLLTRLTGIDAAAEFDRARTALLSFLNQWSALPQSVSSMVWKFLDEGVDLKMARQIAQTIANLTPDTLDDFLAPHLKDVNFFQSPQGKFLEALADEQIVALFMNDDLFQKFKTNAALVASILDSSALQGILVRLQQFVNQALSLDALKQVVQQTDFDVLDLWLRRKLSDFLGRNFSFADLDKIRESIDKIVACGPTLYQKAVDALRHKYSYDFAATFQSTTTNTALLDIVFDFSQDTAAVGQAFENAVNGRLDDLLLNPVKGVTLNAAALTHGVKRQSHVELTLPFYQGTADHINNSLASVEAIDQQDGRLLIYDLTSQDTVSQTTRFFGNTRRNSVLTISGNLPMAASPKLRKHRCPSFHYSYSFRQASQRSQKRKVRYQLKPFVDSYFPGAFPAPSRPGATGSFEDWIESVDVTLQKAGQSPGDWGNVLVALDVAAPGETLAGWVQAPSDPSDPAYAQMSRAIQCALRRLIPLCYFQDLTKFFGAPSPVAALLVWSCLPVSTQIQLQGQSLVLNTGPDLFWNYPDSNTVQAMAYSSPTAQTLATRMKEIHDQLVAIGKPNEAGFYDLGQLRRILGEAIQHDGAIYLNRLLTLEAWIIHGAARAAQKVASFVAQSTLHPTKAIEALCEFGSGITDTFNSQLNSVYGNDALRPLGTLVFIEASKAFHPQLGQIASSALLDLMILRKDATFPPAGFPDKLDVDRNDVLLEQRLVQVS